MSDGHGCTPSRSPPLPCRSRRVGPRQDAAAYPDKPVTIMVRSPPAAKPTPSRAWSRRSWTRPWASGSSSRNKAGAGGNLGVGQSRPRRAGRRHAGHGHGQHARDQPTLYKNLPYDPDTAFAPISLFVTLPNVLTVNPKIEAKTVPELIELVRAKLDTYTFRLLRRRRLDRPRRANC